LQVIISSHLPECVLSDLHWAEFIFLSFLIGRAEISLEHLPRFNPWNVVKCLNSCFAEEDKKETEMTPGEREFGFELYHV